ncbi:unnamed protein product, partial [Prorocentrum cordatum]
GFEVRVGGEIRALPSRINGPGNSLGSRVAAHPSGDGRALPPPLRPRPLRRRRAAGHGGVDRLRACARGGQDGTLHEAGANHAAVVGVALAANPSAAYAAKDFDPVDTVLRVVAIVTILIGPIVGFGLIPVIFGRDVSTR